MKRWIASASALSIIVLWGCASVTTKEGPPDRRVSPPQPGQAPPPPAAEAAPPLRAPPLAVVAPTHSRVPSLGCLKDPSSAEVSQARADHARFNQGALQQELQRQGLTVMALPSEMRVLHQGVSGQGVAPKAVPAGMIPGPSQWSGQGTEPEIWRFVQTAGGAIYRLRAQNLSARRKEVWLCGCRKARCRPQGSGCGGCGVTRQRLYGPMPEGTMYKGELHLPFNGEALQVRYEAGPCPPSPKDCPPGRP